MTNVRPPSEQHRVGIGYVEAATELLQRIRSTHPTAGLYEAADFQWWWRNPRSTDRVAQLFWFDDVGRPAAAVIVTDRGDAIALDPILMPMATREWVAHVVGRGLGHARRSGFEEVDVELDRADDVMRDVWTGHGFAPAGDGVIEAWMVAEDRPEIGPLADRYRLYDRRDTVLEPHHLSDSGRNHRDVERRLRQTSLYRPDLDLVVHGPDGDVAAYGLFWFDPRSATGLVEPMRTVDAHRRRGLARHVLTAGIDRLARAGATRIKVCHRPDDPAARDLYRGVGFEAARQTAVFTGRTG